MEDQIQHDSDRTATVRGQGVARVRPDGIIVGLTVQHRAETAAEALNEAARKARFLESLFREFEIEEEGWAAGSISLQEWTQWDESGRREERRGYVASSRVVVRLINISRLGPILAEAAARTEASVDGPRWEIRPENPAHDEARRRAMEDANHRADTYAQAAGLSVGDVLEVVEAGAQPNRLTIEQTSSARTLGGYTPTVEMPTHSEGLEIVAGVQVTYALHSR